MKKKTLLLIILSSVVTLGAVGTSLGLYFSMKSKNPALSSFVEVYETTGTKSKLQARQDDIEWRPYEFSGNTEVNVYPDVKRNVLHGTGVAITHSSAYLLQTLSEEKRMSALESLFDSEQGALTVVRIPIGTSDYTNTDAFYTHDDMPLGQKDYELESFSVDADEEYLIPTLLNIRAINPDIIFVAAPWSAPAWMKTNESLIGGNLIGHNQDSLTNEENAYANYLVQFLNDYKLRGINIRYLSLINEPTIANVSYPSMQMGTPQYIRVAEKVSEYLSDHNLATKIMAYDHNVGSESDRFLFNMFAEEINNNEALKSTVSGFAFHAYGAEWSNVYSSLFANNRDSYPEMENYMTEITESDESIDFAANLSWSSANVTVGPLSHGASMSIYWNALLTSDGQPVLGNNAHCYGMLSLKNDIITKSAAYYSFTHISKYTQSIDGKRSYLIDSLSDNEAKIKCASYRRGDGSYAYVLANNDSTTYEDVDLVMNGEVVTYRLQPESIVTLVAPLQEKHEEYNSGFKIYNIKIVQKTIEQYELFVTLEKEHEDLEFRIGDSDDYQESTISVHTNEAELTYKIVVESPLNDFYLWAVSNEKMAFLPLSIPKMQPNVIVAEDIATITFGLDIDTSWSSFCDPYGKAVYRGATPTFDENAELVNRTTAGVVDPIYILEETYQDVNYNEEKPYYFLVMTGKNGLSTFVSYPLVDGAQLFSDPHLTLNSISGAPSLQVTATITGNIAPANLILCVKEIDGESFEVTSSSSSSLDYRFDCSQLNKSGVWYDIVIIDKTTEIAYEIGADAMERNNITIGNRRYAFKEWDNLAKIAFESLNYFGASADIASVGEEPKLIVSGVMNGNYDAELLITFWTGMITETLIVVPNESTLSNHFEFSLDLNELTTQGLFYDVVLNINNERSDMTSDMVINFARTLNHGGRTYSFARWEGLLKITFN
ncbi:MAG: hypothetical protein WCR77_01970 [Bacilli bacterium]